MKAQSLKLFLTAIKMVFKYMGLNEGHKALVEGSLKVMRYIRFK